MGAGGPWGDRVDERCAVRARPARRARLGGADRRRDQGQGAWRRWPARPTRSTPGCWPPCRPAIWCRRSGCPIRASVASANWRAFRLHLVSHRTTLKNRIHAALIAFGHPCPVSDLFGHAGRELLDRLAIPDPWRANIDVSLQLIDDLELQIARLTVELKRQGADHRYIPLLVTAPGFGWVNAFTVASEIGDINRFASPAKLCGYTGLCPRVNQSGASDRRGPISKHGPKYLRWALFEAALNACKHPLYKERYQHTKRRLGRQRGPKVAQIELSRRLTEAIWHMLTRNQPFAPAGAPFRLAA